MPKEVVFSGREFSVMDGGEVDVSELTQGQGLEILRRAAVVRWSKGHCHVELGVAKLEISSHEESADRHYLQLDRSAINRLIQSLRKARDQAFGADA